MSITIASSAIATTSRRLRTRIHSISAHRSARSTQVRSAADTALVAYRVAMLLAWLVLDRGTVCVGPDRLGVGIDLQEPRAIDNVSRRHGAELSQGSHSLARRLGRAGEAELSATARMGLLCLAGS